jgi:hypothetical protein
MMGISKKDTDIVVSRDLRNIDIVKSINEYSSTLSKEKKMNPLKLLPVRVVR